MKNKFLTILLTAVLCFTLCFASACNQNDLTNDNNGNEEQQEEQLTLPIISLNFNGTPPLTKEDDYKDCTVTTSNCDSSFVLDNVDAEVKIRGNSTSEGAKKPYRIKFKSKQGMLGLNDGAKCKSWVLLADYYDYSSMRNYFIYSLGDVFNNTYVADVQHVNLFIENEYKGVYLLTEQTQINKYRINIDEDNVETSINTGYLIEADSRALSECVLFDVGNGYAEYLENNPKEQQAIFGVCKTVDDITPKTDYCFAVTYNIKTSYGHDPKTRYQLFAVKNDLSSNSQIAFDQLDFISERAQLMYDLIFDNYLSYNEYTFTKYIDLNSLVDMLIINNIASLRGGKRSDYYYIDMSENGDKLFHFGPPWDYDLDCGNYGLSDNRNDYYGDNPNAFPALKNQDYVNGALWNRDFIRWEVEDRWNEVDGYIKLNDLLQTINPNNPNSIPNKHKVDFTKNFEVNNVWGTKNYEFLNNEVYLYTCHEDAVFWFYNWMNEHLTYANSVWGL